ncbi:hypothetical protein DFH06DRAFT_1165655 [Mycena polygramma]|nr:hypothetical protein DFH06DRAFT_1165655 [Mycena polygramma]
MLRFHVPRALGRAQPTRSFSIARSLNKKTIPTTLPVSSRAFSSSIATKIVSGRQKEAEEKQTFASASEEEPHDPNCVCQDPNARLTGDTLTALVDFIREFTPSTLSAPEIDDAITHSLQYLRSVDIPARELSCCAHTLGQYHSEAALKCLIKVMASDQFKYNPYLVTRLVQAWPEIRAWLQYTFTNRITFGMFIDRQKQDRIEGYRSIIPFLQVVCRIPDLRELLLRTPSERQNMFLVLSFCWRMESEGWFELQEDYAQFTSAAIPLATLAQAHIDGKKSEDDFFPVLQLVAARAKLDPAKVASIALDRVKDPTSVPLSTLAAHIAMIRILGMSPSYSPALLAQNSIQNMIRILDELTSRDYDPTTAQEVEACIRPCLRYLSRSLVCSDGCSFVAQALHTGILPALMRSSKWLLPESDGHVYLQTVLEVISVYAIYPSVFWSFGPTLKAFAKTEEEAIKQLDPTIQKDLMTMTAVITYRLAMLLPSANLNCENCGQPVNPFEAETSCNCDQCFMSSYCSEACRTTHWTNSHREECKTLLDARKDGFTLPILLRDFEFGCDVAMVELRINRVEIANVWKRERPERTPVVSVDFTDDFKGRILVGEEALANPPPFLRGPPGLDLASYFRALWDAETSKEFHDEHVVVCIFLPHGPGLQTHWRWIPISPEYTEGTVVDRLINTVEFSN